MYIYTVRFFFQLNQRTLYEYTQLMNEMDQGRGPSPYTLPQLPMMESMTPRPPGPPKSNCPIKKSRRRIQHTDALGRPIKFKEQNKVNFKTCVLLIYLFLSMFNENVSTLHFKAILGMFISGVFTHTPNGTCLKTSRTGSNIV